MKGHMLSPPQGCSSPHPSWHFMFTRGVTLLFLPCLVTPLVALYFFAHLPFLLHADCFLPHPIFFPLSFSD